MKTTLICFGKCGKEVLTKCSDLPDTRFVLFSDAEAPSFVYQPQAQNELVITVSYARRTQGIDITGIRKRYFINVDFVDIGLRSSPAYNGQLNVEFVILPFKHIKMLTELHEIYADRNVVFIPEIGSQKESEDNYLSACIHNIADKIHTLKCMADYAGCDVASLDIKDIHNVFGHEDGTYKIIESVTKSRLTDCIDYMDFYLDRYLRITPQRLVCQIISAEPPAQYLIDKMHLFYEDVKIGVTKATEESKSVKLSYIAAFNWSESDHYFP